VTFLDAGGYGEQGNHVTLEIERQENRTTYEREVWAIITLK
jgi:hypothetical protein